MKTIHAVMLALAGCGLCVFPAHAATTMIVCQGGGSMRIDDAQSKWVITFERAAEAANVATPGPGECALPEVALPDGSATTLTLSKGLKNSTLLLAAAKGGTFEAEVSGQGGTLVVASVGQVNVVDAEPLNEEPADEAAEVEEEPVDADDGMCPATTAVVFIPEPNLKSLNVRKKPGGKVIKKIPEGEPVSVVGLCGSGGGAAGLVAGKVESDWCQIDDPVEGCVMAKYLKFDGGLLDDAAGLAKKN